MQLESGFSSQANRSPTAPMQVAQYADLLEFAGIDTVPDLVQRIGSLIVSHTLWAMGYGLWAMANGFLTHSLKLKRDQVEQQFGAAIAGCGDRMCSERTLFILPA